MTKHEHYVFLVAMIFLIFSLIFMTYQVTNALI